jgi:hypothetical protein
MEAISKYYHLTCKKIGSCIFFEGQNLKTSQNKIGCEYYGQSNILINIGFRIKAPIIFYLKLFIGSRINVVGLMSNNHWTFLKIKMGT